MERSPEPETAGFDWKTVFDGRGKDAVHIDTQLRPGIQRVVEERLRANGQEQDGIFRTVLTAYELGTLCWWLRASECEEEYSHDQLRWLFGKFITMLKDKHRRSEVCSSSFVAPDQVRRVNGWFTWGEFQDSCWWTI